MFAAGGSVGDEARLGGGPVIGAAGDDADRAGVDDGAGGGVFVEAAADDEVDDAVAGLVGDGERDPGGLVGGAAGPGVLGFGDRRGLAHRAGERAAAEDAHRAGIGGGGGVVAGLGGDDVSAAVAVDVGDGEGAAEVVGVGAGVDAVGGRGEAAVAGGVGQSAAEDVDDAVVAASAGCGGGEVADAVAVDVTGGEAGAEREAAGADEDAFGVEGAAGQDAAVGGEAEARLRSEEDEHAALVVGRVFGAGVFVGAGGDGKVGEAVAVEVAGGERDAKVVAVAHAGERLERFVAEGAVGQAGVDVDGAAVFAGEVVEPGSDDEVGVAVAVDVGGGQRAAKLVFAGAAVDDLDRGGAQPLGAAAVEEDRAVGEGFDARLGVAEDAVGVAVAVEVAGAVEDGGVESAAGAAERGLLRFDDVDDDGDLLRGVLVLQVEAGPAGRGRAKGAGGRVVGGGAAFAGDVEPAAAADKGDGHFGVERQEQLWRIGGEGGVFDDRDDRFGFEPGAGVAHHDHVAAEAGAGGVAAFAGERRLRVVDAQPVFAAARAADHVELQHLAGRDGDLAGSDLERAGDMHGRERIADARGVGQPHPVVDFFDAAGEVGAGERVDDRAGVVLDQLEAVVSGAAGRGEHDEIEGGAERLGGLDREGWIAGFGSGGRVGAGIGLGIRLAIGPGVGREAAVDRGVGFGVGRDHDIGFGPVDRLGVARLRIGQRGFGGALTTDEEQPQSADQRDAR